MRKALLLLVSFFVMSPAIGAEIKSTIIDSVQLTVDGPALQTSRVGGQYSVSGNNVSVTTLGHFDVNSTSGAITFGQGDYEIQTDGAAFTFSESIIQADALVTSQTQITNNGRIDTPNLYSESTVYQGGTAGSLAGTIRGDSTPTITAGGPGSTGIGQRTVELSVFR